MKGMSNMRLRKSSCSGVFVGNSLAENNIELVSLMKIKNQQINRSDVRPTRLMEIKALLRRISFKYQLGRLQEHEQRSSRMYSTDSSKSYGLKQIRGGPLSMIHVGNKKSSP